MGLNTGSREVTPFPHTRVRVHTDTYKGADARTHTRIDKLKPIPPVRPYIVQELCESRGGRPGLSVLTSLLASVDVKLY